ncbi:MAG: biopolymer transporter ExbD [Chromatiales bacterium]|nr:biopolymer transporter ExbD [Chromatiales bacterium]
MSVGSGGGEGAPMMEMNTTPLIDVMLVLIIMLIVTLPVMTHAVKLDMPQTNNPPPLVPPEVINIMVDYDNSISWNGTPVPNLATLERYFKVESQKDPQPQVAIEAHPRAKYDTVAQVLASAQRNSMVKMGIVGTEKFQ